MTNDPSKNFLDVGINIVDSAIRKGYLQAWFTWLGWVTGSSLIYVLGSNAHSFVVQAIGGLSIVATLLAGLVGLERLRDDWFQSNGDTMPIWNKLIGVVLILVIGVYVIFEIITVIFKLTVSTNGMT